MDGENGLICAYALDGGGGATPLDWDGIANWKPAHGALWVHLDHAAEGSRQWIRETSGLDEAVGSILLARETRPRSMDLTLGFLVLLRGINLNPGQEPEDMVSIRIWVEPNRIITLRHRKLMAVEDLQSLIQAGKGPRDAPGLFAMLAELLADRMEPILSDLEHEISRIEKNPPDARRWLPRRPSDRPRLGELQRDAIAIRRYLEPQHRALAAFDDNGFSFVNDVQRMSLRETEDRITRYEEDLTAQIERATALHEQIT
ncbi:MAG: zinc transporter ZntB, partial [Proteobacteria bacterium]|nr:zinc transporter ZntB [Pseudomonadota bacterium]